MSDWQKYLKAQLNSKVSKRNENEHTTKRQSKTVQSENQLNSSKVRKETKNEHTIKRSSEYLTLWPCAQMFLTTIKADQIIT